MKETRFNIGIAGAGISGLIAGRELQRAGHQVFIFESRLRTGGRVYSVPFNGFIIEAGPEFIHGNSKETIRLLEEYHIGYVPIHGKMYRFSDRHLSPEYGMTEGWDLLLEKMKSLNEDLAFGEFLNQYFPGNQFQNLRDSAIRFAEGFDLADVKTASTQALIAEWDQEDSAEYRIPEGYGTIIREIENDFKKLGGKIFLGHAVHSVDWNSNRVRFIVNEHRTFEMDKCIISLPVSLLKKANADSESLTLNPVPAEKVNAIARIGFGTVVKVIMIWHSSFWETLVPEAQFIFSDLFIPTWWTQYPLDLPVLTGWLGGSQAEKWAGQPDAFFLNKALESLSIIFSIPVNDLKKLLKGSSIFNWKTDPWSQGAYSFAQVGYQKDKAVCRKSISGRIYFTGEGYYDGPNPGTVEAAIVSGMTTAKLLQDEMIKM